MKKLVKRQVVFSLIGFAVFSLMMFLPFSSSTGKALIGFSAVGVLMFMIVMSTRDPLPLTAIPVWGVFFPDVLFGRSFMEVNIFIDILIILFLVFILLSTIFTAGKRGLKKGLTIFLLLVQMLIVFAGFWGIYYLLA
jgi:hypothetical protein